MKTRSLLGIVVVASVGVVALALATRSGARAGVAISACTDLDGDGYGLGCAAVPDCNDRDPAIHPGAVEICNFKDDDCNGLVDEVASCQIGRASCRERV